MKLGEAVSAFWVVGLQRYTGKNGAVFEELIKYSFSVKLNSSTD